MGRKASVRYWPSRRGYWTTLNGVQQRLADGPDDFPDGPTYRAAQQAYWSLLELARVPLAKDRSPIRAVLETYMQHAEKLHQPSTCSRRLTLLRPFVEAHGSLAVGVLTHTILRDFISRMREKRPPWGDGAERNFLAVLKAAFNWAVAGGLLTSNPAAGIKPPSVRSRSRDCLIPPELHARILAGVTRSQAFRDLITCLHGTGCRPGELCAATAAAWDGGKQALVYLADWTRQEGEHRHKTAGKKDRVIPFRGDALDVVNRLLVAHPRGPLFRTARGRAWTPPTICSTFVALRDRLGVPSLTAYSYRHTYATNWLLTGKPIDVLAAVLGNTPEVIRRHYSHLLGDWTAVEKYL